MVQYQSFTDFLLDAFEQGGFVVYPIALCSIIGWSIILKMTMIIFIEQAYLKKISGKRSYLAFFTGMFKFRAKFMVQDIKKHSDLSSEDRTELWFVLKQKFLFMYDINLKNLFVMASIPPLLGLLGTVNGIIRTFDVVSVYGTNNTSMLSDSIGEALVSTQNGILVAFPLMIFHILVKNKLMLNEKFIEKIGLQEINR